MEKENGSAWIKIIGIIILLAVAGLSLRSFFFSSSNQAPNSASALSPVHTLTTPLAVEAKMINGIQEVTLSWGKLNYNPEIILVKKDIPVKITADTDRLQGCFRSLNIKNLAVSKSFTEKDNILTFTPRLSGDFGFSCAMGMGRGILRVQ